jgi:hypothetical protein
MTLGKALGFAIADHRKAARRFQQSFRIVSRKKALPNVREGWTQLPSCYEHSETMLMAWWASALIRLE